MLLVCVVLAAALSACGVEPSPSFPGAPTDTLAPPEITVIGEMEGPEEYLFGDVTSLAVDADGVVYVADRIGSTVRAYDASGAYLGTVGSAGQGPGEFEWPADLTFDSGGRLYARDATRISVFGRRPGAALADSLERTIPLGRFRPRSTRGRVVGSEYYFPSYYYFMFVTSRYFFEVFDSTGATGDTVHVPDFPKTRVLARANYLISDEGGLNVEGVNLAPFEPAPRWALTARGTLVTSNGAEYELVELGAAGDTLRVVSFPREPRPISDAEHSDSTDAFQVRLDSIPVPLDEVNGMSDMARSGRLPTVLPEVIGLETDAEGALWVRRWPAGPDQTVFDVVDMDRGRIVRTVVIGAELESDPPPWVSSAFVAGVVRDSATGLERIAVFDLAGGGRE